MLIALFSFAFSYKTLKYVAQLKVIEICYTAEDMDCEGEKEDALEKDEITDNFYPSSFAHKNMLLTAERFVPVELIVNFISANYSHSIYSPPEKRC
jgi:hypothetical protein